MTVNKNPRVVDLHSETIIAAAALPARRFVGYDNALCGAGAPAKGVTKEAIAQGAEGAIHCFGKALVEAGGTIAAGDLIVSNADGKAVKATALGATITNTNNITATLPSGETTVKSDAESPTIAIGGNISSSASFSGGALPETVLGVAETNASNGQMVLIRLY